VRVLRGAGRPELRRPGVDRPLCIQNTELESLRNVRLDDEIISYPRDRCPMRELAEKAPTNPRGM
jgi:hypothetical protein